MTTAASLDSTSVRVTPGDQVVVPLQIRNNGTVVEHYGFEVVGPAREWVVVAGLEQGVLPGSTTSTTVTFAPPRTAHVPAGEVQFGVVVTPSEHPEQAVVPEGVVDVLPFLETTSELVPRTSQGRRTGRHQVAVDNRGNAPVTVVLEGIAQAEGLAVVCRPPAVTVLPGEAVFADVRARAARPLWRNRPVTHQIEVLVTPKDSTGITLQGSFVQGPMVPPWLWKALLALLLLLVALVVAWLTLLKPAIESQAQEAAEEAVADEAAQAEEAAGAAEQAAGSAGSSAQEATAARNEVRARTGRPPAPVLTETPVAQRLTTDGATPDSFVVPAGNTFRLTDLVLGNPQGDFGRATILVDGEVLFEVALENFRDLDYHFVSPVVVEEDGVVVLSAVCNRPGRPPGVEDAPSACDVSMFLGGTLVRPAAEQ